MEEAQGEEGRTGQSCSRKNDEASGTAETGNVQHSESSNSTSKAGPSNDARNADAKTNEVQMDEQGRLVSTDNRERSGSVQIEQPGPVEPLEKKHKGSASTTAATERLAESHKGNDIGMVDDFVTVTCGQQVHTAHTARGCEDD